MQTEIADFISMMLRCAMPIMICGLGLVFSAKAGTVNIGAEGMMLTGSLMAVVGTHLFGNAVMGIVVAMLSSMLLSLIFAFFTVTIRADQTVMGMSINILALGFTTMLYRVLFGMNTTPVEITGLQTVALPGLSALPVLGPSLFSQNWIVYISFLLVPLTHVFLYRTRTGLSIRAVGEYPRACDTMGINVYQVRYGTILFSGLMSGLAGAYLSLGLLSFFVEDLTAGRGFMAVAAVVFGKYSPVGVMLAALVFGAGDALQYRLQVAGSGIPYQFLLMIPYVLTVVAVCGFTGKNKGPSAMGRPYVKE